MFAAQLEMHQAQAQHAAVNANVNAAKAASLNNRSAVMVAKSRSVKASSASATCELMGSAGWQALNTKASPSLFNSLAKRRVCAA